MKQHFTYWVLSLMLIVCFSCKKELPPLPDSPNPIFAASGMIDGQSITMQAGVEDFFTHSEEWLWNGVPVYRGSISNGTSFFQLDWYSGDVWKLAGDVQQILNQTHLSCVTTPIPLVLSVSSCANELAFSSFMFQLNSGSMQQQVVFSEPGSWDVKCAALQSNGMESWLSNKVIIGYDSRSLFRLHAEQTGNSIQTQISDFTQSIDSVKWTLGNFSTTTIGTTAQLPVNTGSHILHANVFFTNGIARNRQIALAIGEREDIADYVFGLEQAWHNLFDWKVGLTIRVGQEEYETHSVVQQQPVQITIQSKVLYTDPSTQKQVIKMDFDVMAKFRKISSGEEVHGEFAVSLALPIPE
jgi:hypothetical protein